MIPALVWVFLLLPVFAQARKYTDAEVEQIHRGLLLIDTHNDITSNTVRGFDIGKPSADTHTDIPRMKQGGLGAQFFAVYVAASYADGNRAAHRALEMIDTVRRDIAGKYPGDFELVTTADGVLAARKKGRIAALMGIEGGHAIEDSLRLLRAFYDLGIRYMTLTHSNHNNWADSSGPPQPRHNGLTDFGRQVVLEMNRLGMMVDISHVSDKTFWDALEVSKAPLFASHSSCRALSNIPRNMTDDMIKALAKKGGVVQLNFGCEFLSQKAADASPMRAGGGRGRFSELQEKYKNDPTGYEEAMAKLRAGRRKTQVRPTLEDVVAHIDRIVKIAGVAYVGIGSDFDGVTCTPEGLDDVSKFPNLTRALLEKGYPPADIARIYGGNLLRVMRSVALQAAPR
ncbi:MAG: membrane dipeptidase [Acidobacteria bacterium]|nr:membrane dipeptidase [Acidobacteriota bacterium]